MREIDDKHLKALWRTVQSHPRDGAIWLKPNGEFIEFNRNFLGMLGISAKNLKAKTIWDFTPDNWHTYERVAFARLAEGEEPSRLYHKELLRADGDLLSVEVFAHAVFDEGGKSRGIWCYMRPLSTQARANAPDKSLETTISCVEAQEKIEHLNSLLKSIRDVNQLIIQERELGALFDGASDILRNTRCYESIEISVLDAETGTIMPVANAGIYDRREWKISAKGEGDAPKCIVECFKTKQDVIVNNPEEHCAECQYYVGNSQTIVIPIKQGKSCVGFLCASLKFGHDITDDEVQLLEGIAGDLGFARKKYRTEQALRKSEEKYRTIVGVIPDMIIKVNRDGVYLDIIAEDDLLLKPISSVIGKSIMDIIPEEKAAQIMKQIRKSIDEKSPQNVEYELEVPLGKRFFEARIISSVADEAIALIRDITDRKEMEEALREEKDKLSTIADTLPGAICILCRNPDGSEQFSYVSHVVKEIFGIPSEKLEKSAELLWRGIHPKDVKQVESEIAESAKFLTPWQSQFRYIHTKKGEIWIETRFIPSRGEAGATTWHGIIFDITDRKLWEKKLDDVNRELKEKNKELEQIIYVASHDMRTPLVTIAGFSNELALAVDNIIDIIESEKCDLGTAGERVKEIIEDDIPSSVRFMTSGISRIQLMLDGLLMYSRTGREEMHFKTVDMGAIIKTIVESSMFGIEGSGIEVDVGELPPCKADRIKITQVFSNLIENAIKFQKPGREGKIEISGKKKGKRVVYCVKDNGIGIPKNKIDDIFLLFYKVDSMSNFGEGLGLSVVKKLVEKNNGRVWVESEFGEGCAFYVELPAA